MNGHALARPASCLDPTRFFDAEFKGDELPAGREYGDAKKIGAGCSAKRQPKSCWPGQHSVSFPPSNLMEGAV